MNELKEHSVRSTRTRRATIALVLTCLLVCVSGCTQTPVLPDWAYKQSDPSTAVFLGEHGDFSFYSAQALDKGTCLIAVRDNNTGGIECGVPPLTLELENDTFIFSETTDAKLEQIAKHVFK